MLISIPCIGISGYESSHNRSDPSVLAAPLTVDSTASLFETAAHAHAQFDSWMKTFPVTQQLPVYEVWIPVDVEWTALPTPEVGDESAAFQSSLAFKTETHSMEWAFHLVGFRKSRILGFSLVVSTPVSADYSMAKRFAQAMESRVRQYLEEE